MSTDTLQNALFNFALKHGDDRLILGHRLSEWSSAAPILEEDIAMSNIALDMLGQAVLFLSYAGEIEGKGRNEDALAYTRPERNFRNLLLTEQYAEDFAYALARQFFYDVYDFYFMEALQNSSDERLKGIAEKSLKEAKYHLRHSSEWMLRLGDGTEESHNRIGDAVSFLWMYTGEMFEIDEHDNKLITEGIVPDVSALKQKWYSAVSQLLHKATIEVPPSDAFMQTGGRKGIHTENLGHILAEMQYLRRAYPDAKW
jgi:ring-1,2-phenylacetyl-CoA epoxidase subunit PaaC